MKMRAHATPPKRSAFFSESGATDSVPCMEMQADARSASTDESKPADFVDGADARTAHWRHQRHLRYFRYVLRNAIVADARKCYKLLPRRNRFANQVAGGRRVRHL